MKVVPSILNDDCDLAAANHGAVQCRAIVSNFPSGVRVPDIGSSAHTATEISLVLAGVFDLESGGEKARLTAGDLVIVPPGEEHSFHVRADTRIFTLTIGEA